MSRTRSLRALVVFAAGILLALPVWADDVEDSIKEGLELYKAGEYQEAVESLNYAVQLIQQQKGRSLEKLLPEPLSGWEVEETTSQAAGAAMFGGGVSAQRSYRKGDAYVTVLIAADSPLIQTMVAMFANPMIVSSDGGRLQRIQRQKAIVKYDEDDRSGSINIVVDRRFLVNVEGSDVSQDELVAYARAIDYKALKGMP
ncbi:MAG TPA: hypothetical protein ENK62_07290 [Chromatiales bacterium]|nr:hypothetical protein [Chromatiales bacterium]